MTMINETIEPDLKGAERQELSHLDYFRRKIEELRDRGLIAGDSFETISSEIRLRREPSSVGPESWWRPTTLQGQKSGPRVPG